MSRMVQGSQLLRLQANTFKTGYLTNASIQVQSSHEELPEQFTDAPYKAGMGVMVIYHMKNYQRSLLGLYIRLTVVHHTKNYKSSLLMFHKGWYVCYGRSLHEELPE